MPADHTTSVNNCPFCKKTKADYFLESENFAAIYNISPIVPGHSLIIPKKHVESLFDLSKEELAEFMLLGRNTAKLINHFFHTDAFDWAIQEKEAAGQSVAHLHMHVVPRKMNDLPDPGAWYQALENSEDGIDTFDRFRLSEEHMRELTNRLKEEAMKLKFD
ncbi:MAG: HIT family protein [Ginsengibacter sp.]